MTDIVRVGVRDPCRLARPWPSRFRHVRREPLEHPALRGAVVRRTRIRDRGHERLGDGNPPSGRPRLPVPDFGTGARRGQTTAALAPATAITEARIGRTQLIRSQAIPERSTGSSRSQSDDAGLGQHARTPRAVRSRPGFLRAWVVASGTSGCSTTSKRGGSASGRSRRGSRTSACLPTPSRRAGGGVINCA